MSIVSSPGTEKTYSQPSAARQSTRSDAAVRGVTTVIDGVYVSPAAARPDRILGR